ncbi:MAG TPA: deoxynucleoside kinase [Verrucomicrobiae bacterium]|jgi:thymidylate kinase|nr:deoxynucleoside kinase [Verrucomicrobiae bacterium]
MTESRAGRSRRSGNLNDIRLPAFASGSGAGPFVIAIEGPNGAGKTTLTRALARKLEVPSCLGTDKAWFSRSFKVQMIRHAEWYASAMFFLSGCFEQMRALQKVTRGAVVMDRCLWSTLAVHAATDKARLSALVKILEPIARQIRVPQLTIVLEASFETCQDRIARKSGTARELDELTANPGFHERERAFYHWLGAQNKTIRFLDVNRSGRAEVAQNAFEMVQPVIRANRD